MLNRTHIAFSLFFGLILFYFVEEPLFFFVALILGTLLPDLDSFNSKIGKRFFSRVLVAFTKHRGVMHSLFFMFLIYFVLHFYLPLFSLGFLVGYSSHLIGDLITKQGLRLFYPFKTRFHGFMKVGGRIESFLFFIFVVLDFILVFRVVIESIF